MEVKVGDRVKIEFEGEVTDISSSEVLVLAVDFETWVLPLHVVAVILPPIPTSGDAVIRINTGILYEYNNTGWWHTPGDGRAFSTEFVQGRADEHGYTVLYEGKEE